MSIATEIARLQADSTAIANAIAAKGVTVPAGSGYDDYASLIASIDTGSLPDWLKDGDTHLWLNITTDEQRAQEIQIRMIGTIDWGDGTTESVSVTTYTGFTHTYASLGKYRIDLKPSSGTFYLGRANTYYCVMGATAGRGPITKALYQVEIGTKRITTLSTYAFKFCRGLLRCYIPKTIVTINSYTFQSCISLREVVFEDYSTVTSTAFSNTFYLCPLLESVSGYNPPAVTSMATTYYSCQLLKEITIPATVTSIGSSTFYQTYSLRKMFCLPDTPPTVSNANALQSVYSGCSIKVPKGSLSAYQAAEYWSDLSSQMVEAGKITATLTNVTSSNKTPMVDLNESYTTTLTAADGYTLGSVTVTMDGVDITSTAYSNGVVTIASVTGNITITATAS